MIYCLINIFHNQYPNKLLQKSSINDQEGLLVGLLHSVRTQQLPNTNTERQKATLDQTKSLMSPTGLNWFKASVSALQGVPMVTEANSDPVKGIYFDEWRV